MEVHGDQMGETCLTPVWQIRVTCKLKKKSPRPMWPCSSTLTSFTHHAGDELGDDGAPLPHLTLLAVGEVGEDTCDALGAGGLTGIHRDQHLHYGGVHISEGGGRDEEHEGVRLASCKWCVCVCCTSLMRTTAHIYIAKSEHTTAV